MVMAGEPPHFLDIVVRRLQHPLTKRMPEHMGRKLFVWKAVAFDHSLNAPYRKIMC